MGIPFLNFENYVFAESSKIPMDPEMPNILNIVAQTVETDFWIMEKLDVQAIVAGIGSVEIPSKNGAL